MSVNPLPPQLAEKLTAAASAVSIENGPCENGFATSPAQPRAPRLSSKGRIKEP